MNIYNLKEESTVFEELGYCMDTPERMKLELALLRLTELADADQLLFWGKIVTMSVPYYVAMAVDFAGKFAFPHKKFYYCRDNFVFQELPQLDVYNRAQANNFNSLPFTGNPATVLINAVPEGEEKKEVPKAEEEDSQDQVVKIQPKNFTEEDRLSYTVRAIETECQVVPIGAFRVIKEHQIRYNDSYKGLDICSFGIDKFLHFRYPLSKQAKKILESVSAILVYDFLDHIEQQSYWSAQINTSHTIGTVRSLQWQGYSGYVFFGRNTFGGFYYGNGLKQAQLAFQL